MLYGVSPLALLCLSGYLKDWLCVLGWVFLGAEPDAGLGCRQFDPDSSSRGTGKVMWECAKGKPMVSRSLKKHVSQASELSHRGTWKLGYFDNQLLSHYRERGLRERERLEFEVGGRPCGR